MKKYVFLSALVLAGAAIGVLLAINDWWAIVEPVAWAVQMAMLAAALLYSWLVERKLETSMEQKSFQITFGLRSGYKGEGADFTLADAENAIREWMQARVKAGLPIVTGMVAPVTLLYPVRNVMDEDGTRVTAEKSAVFSGSLSPKYDKGRSDLEVVDTLNSLAKHIGLVLRQKRVYVSFVNRQWTVDIEH